MKTINYHLICPFQRHRCNAFLISSLSKGRGGSKRAFFMRIDEPHRGSAFDSPWLASIASYPGLMCCMGHNAIGVALFKNFIFSKGRGDAGRPCLQDSYMRSPTHPSSYKRESAHRCGMIHKKKKGIWRFCQMPFFFLFSSYPVD